MRKDVSGGHYYLLDDLSSQGTKFFFVPAHLARNCFESLTQEVEFNDDATQGVGLSIPPTMFFNDGPQLGSSIESGFGDSRARGHGHGRYCAPPRLVALTIKSLARTRFEVRAATEHHLTPTLSAAPPSTGVGTLTRTICA